MKIQFNAEQQYQLTAVQSAVRLFEGMDKFDPSFSMNALEIIPNLPESEELWEPNLLDNLMAVQDDNSIQPKNRDLETDEGETLLDIDAVRYPSFSIEMETGTGKTYVYLRTIYELYRTYGFSKFIIVVPSVAIYQGVKKTFEMTRAHFNALYDKPIMHLVDYDGNNVAQVKKFATSPACEILLITLDAFNKKTNNIYKPTDKLPGSPLLPYEYLAQTRPILILDEPQNMDSDTARKALRTLKPLVAFRYSATHKTTPNLLYRLTPVEAFRQGLVKRVEVAGITENDNYNQGFIALMEVRTRAGETPSAFVQTIVQKNGQSETVELTLRQGQDLQKFTKSEEHEGYIVNNISAVPGDEYISFANEVLIPLHSTIGSSRPAVFRAQIRQTIREHMKRQAGLHKKGIKVLSLFFIDRVANYVDGGIIQTVFDEEYTLAAENNAYFKAFAPSEVRDAYFATYKKGKTAQTVYVEQDEANIGSDKDAKKAQKESFELIMRHKELLLTLPANSPDKRAKVCFIFAHSALKEGWDNPNVFQICTLNQTISERKKRQEIGRGMRLAVDQTGQRTAEAGVNVLQVIANESYESYVKGLQKEYIEEGKYADSDVPPKPSKAHKSTVHRNDAVFNRDEFRQMWARLHKDVRYNIQFDQATLIKRCQQTLQTTTFPLPRISVSKGQFVQTEVLITLKSIILDRARLLVETLDTRNNRKTAEFDITVGDNLGDRADFKQYLKNFRVEVLVPDAYNARLKFYNGYEVTQVRPLRFVSELGTVADAVTTTVEVEETFPVFDVVGRAARETKLTRQTIQAIFAKLTPDKKIACIKNPEGFTEKFISIVKNILAEEVAANIVFEIVGNKPLDMDNLFPLDPKFVQDRLIVAGNNSIYDQVQIDSDVEERFVEHRVRDQNKVLFYFKFPKKYTVELPRIIRDYNPDWGIVYEDKDQNTKLELIRETKGSLDKDALRFEHEKLKITCAERYYQTLGFDYRQITDKVDNWFVLKQATSTVPILPLAAIEETVAMNEDPVVKSKPEIALGFDINTNMKEFGLHQGIYSVTDAATMLDLPANKVRNWFRELVREGYEGLSADQRVDAANRLISFHGLIELYVIGKLRDDDVTIRQILKARADLKNKTGKQYPFATNDVKERLRTDGRRLYFYFEGDDNPVTLDGSGQFNLNLILVFFDAIEFDTEGIAQQMFPPRGNRKVVIDPKQGNGKPVIVNKEVLVNLIASIYDGPESLSMLADEYDLNEDEVKGALSYAQVSL